MHVLLGWMHLKSFSGFVFQTLSYKRASGFAKSFFLISKIFRKREVDFQSRSLQVSKKIFKKEVYKNHGSSMRFFLNSTSSWLFSKVDSLEFPIEFNSSTSDSFGLVLLSHRNRVFHINCLELPLTNCASALSDLHRFKYLKCIYNLWDSLSISSNEYRFGLSLPCKYHTCYTLFKLYFV